MHIGDDDMTCPVCGDYCQGHSDPLGAEILEDHDDGDHKRCHTDADCDPDGLRPHDED